MQSIAAIDLCGQFECGLFLFFIIILFFVGVSWHDPTNGSANCSGPHIEKNITNIKITQNIEKGQYLFNNKALYIDKRLKVF